MTTCVFVQIRCKPGTTYKVADAIVLREIHSELFSTSGEYDLLLKLYVPAGEDVGVYINDNIAMIEGVERTLTTLTFNAFSENRRQGNGLDRCFHAGCTCYINIILIMRLMPMG